jgi:UDP-N-acetylglucosamine/UDP-N-acetylgalactosamine diphosphorylase
MENSLGLKSTSIVSNFTLIILPKTDDRKPKTQTKESTMINVDELRARYAAAGHDHVFQYMHDLSDNEKEELIEQLSGIELERLASLLASAQAEVTDDSLVEPFLGTVGRSSDESIIKSAGNLGLQAIANGQVAAVVLAAGQGSRLCYDGPKGMYDIGLPSGRTLFAMMAQRIKKLGQLAAATSSDTTAAINLPFYIMTSPLNHAATVAYFEENSYFGLAKDSVFMFQQCMLPCLTEEGKLMMESRGKVAMAPDGNGGVYASMSQSGALSKMKLQGVKYLHIFSIDNALVKPADPVFIGYCLQQSADCGNKVVWKAHAHEKVGVVASKAGKPCIVEYSEITKTMAEQTGEQGRLVFGAGNICNHFYTLDFIHNKILANVGDLYHIAYKKIPYCDPATGETITPTANNGIKLETFIFDVFPMSEKMAVLVVERSDEFAPVKNKAGSPSDSPDTACAMIFALAKQWVLSAGGTLVEDKDNAVCEISPLLSYAGEGLESVVQKNMACPLRLEL